MASLTTLVLLSALLSSSALCQMSGGGGSVNGLSDCRPDIPPELPNDQNVSIVALQMHQWVWIENLTAPDWAQKTDSGGMFYEFLKPGYVRQQTLRLRTMYNERGLNVYVNTSFVTNGVTLCASALTEYRNRSSGALNSVSCSRICHENFTTLGTRANLPILIYDDWIKQSRFNEYLAFDAVEPESRAAYNCTGHFKQGLMMFLPQFLNRRIQCREGDECLFNYQKYGELVSAGCKQNFAEYNWCVSDIDLCSFNIEGNCPICCRGELCNLEVANKAYQRWLNGSATVASSLWVLAVGCFSILQSIKLF